jgi:16S rRNA (uracil1498-N3)-methyltransferase
VAVRIPRIFVSPEDVDSEGLTFSLHAAHYLRNVLRLGNGERVWAFDGSREYLVELVLSGKGLTEGRIIEVRHTAAREQFEVVLAVSCVRPGPFEQVLRHGTELGVSRFIPVLSARTTRRPVATKGRWQAVVASAAQQSGRVSCPEVEPPLPLDDLLTRQLHGHYPLLLSRSDPAQPILRIVEAERPGRVILLIGPEGGFERAEEVKAFEAGFRPVSLGPGVLRTETAAVVAAGMLVLWFDSVCQEGSPVRAWEPVA